MNIRRLLFFLAILSTIIYVTSVLSGCSCGECCGDTEKDNSEKEEEAQPPPAQQAPSTSVNTCNPAIETPNGRDDDCDGAIDEENCGDKYDNDGDGQIDEGCT